jgi:cell division protein FtsN
MWAHCQNIFIWWRSIRNDVFYSLLFEGIVSAVIVTFMLMLYWDTCHSSDKHGAES